MAKMVKLTSAFPAQDTGKPMTYEFDLDDPEQAAEYAKTKKSWKEETTRWRAMHRNVFRTKPGSPEEMRLTLELDRYNRDFHPEQYVPTALSAVGEFGLGALGSSLGPWGGAIGSKGGAWIGGAAGGALVGKDPVSEGNTMLAGSLIGSGIARGLKGLGTGLMRSALDPPAWLSERFPATWRTALQKRIGLGSARTLTEGLEETGIPGSERAGVTERLLGNRLPVTGAAAARMAEDRAEQRVQTMLQQAQKARPVRLPNGTMGQRGGRISLEKDVLPEVRRRLRAEGPLSRKPSGRIDAQVEVDRILDEVLHENPGAVDYVRAHALKRGAQTEAADLFEQRTRAAGNVNLIDANAAIREQVMKELNDVLLDRLRKAVPGYRAAESRVTDLMGLQRALKFREAQQVGGLDMRAGGASGAVRFDPFALLPPHARSTAARYLYGPGAAAVEIGKFPATNALSNLFQPRPNPEDQQP